MALDRDFGGQLPEPARSINRHPPPKLMPASGAAARSGAGGAGCREAGAGGIMRQLRCISPCQPCSHPQICRRGSVSPRWWTLCQASSRLAGIHFTGRCYSKIFEAHKVIMGRRAKSPIEAVRVCTAKGDFKQDQHVAPWSSLDNLGPWATLKRFIGVSSI
jgi:hypothetical protein